MTSLISGYAPNLVNVLYTCGGSGVCMQANKWIRMETPDIEVGEPVGDSCFSLWVHEVGIN